jgi:protease II
MPRSPICPAASSPSRPDVGAREPSPDGNLLAWSADRSGAEIDRLRIMDLANGDYLPDSSPGATLALPGPPTRASCSIWCPMV